MEIILPKKKKKNNYVNNKEFYDLLLEHKKKVDYAKENNLEIPRIPEKIGKIFLDIATHYSSIHKFVGYPFRNDMVSQAVLVCVTYCNSFNPEKYNNPLAYFTRCCHNSFLDTIRVNKKDLYTKFTLMQNSMVTDVMHNHSASNDMFEIPMTDAADMKESEQFISYANDFLRNFNPSKTPKPDESKKEENEMALPTEKIKLTFDSCPIITTYYNILKRHSVQTPVGSETWKNVKNAYDYLKDALYCFDNRLPPKNISADASLLISPVFESTVSNMFRQREFPTAHNNMHEDRARKMLAELEYMEKTYGR